MPIDTKHPEYERNHPKWVRCRDTAEGGDAVKAKGREYLPELSDQDDTDYQAYKDRALFYGAMPRTVQGLVGALFRKPLDLQNIPDDIKAQLANDVTLTNVDFDQFAHSLGKETVTTGFGGVLVEVPPKGGQPYFVQYDAEQIINWRIEQSQDGEFILTRVVLYEKATEPNPEDPYATSPLERLRFLDLEKGRYVQRTFVRRKNHTMSKGPDYMKGYLAESEVVPTLVGAPVNRIPFVFATAEGTQPIVPKPPLLDLVDVNLSHYRTSADLEHGAHFTGLPTAWVAGFPQDLNGKLKIGSGAAWISDNPNANAGFLEFTGQGLTALENRMTAKEQQMAILGARMLENTRPGVETAEALRLRQSGESAALVDIALAISDVLTMCIKWYMRWLNRDPDGVQVVVNTDFTSLRLSAQDLLALVQAWQAGAISKNTMLAQLESGEILPPGRTAEEEEELIDTEPPPFGEPGGLDEGEPASNGTGISGQQGEG